MSKRDTARDRASRKADREHARRHLEALRLELRRAEAARALFRRSLRMRCYQHRMAARGRARALRRRLLEELKTQTRAMIAEGRQRCAAEKIEARRLGDVVQRERAVLAANRRELAHRRHVERLHRQGAEMIRTRKHPGIAKSESDDAVRAELPPDLVPLWDKIGRGIKARPRMSRAETFFQMVHDDPALASQALEGAIRSDDEYARAEASYRAAKRRPALAARASAVPF